MDQKTISCLLSELVDLPHAHLSARNVLVDGLKTLDSGKFQTFSLRTRSSIEL